MIMMIPSYLHSSMCKRDVDLKLYLLVFLVTLEVVVHITGISLFGGDVTTWLTLTLGLVIGCFPVLWSQPERVPDNQTLSPSYLLWLIFLLVGLMVLHYGEEVFTKVDIDYRKADMLPVIEVMSKRFLAGEDPYMTIPQIWDGIQPIYLPALWMPYTLAALCDIDMRWISVIWLLFGLAGYLHIIQSYIHGLRSKLLGILPGVLAVTFMFSLDDSAITMTQEGVVIGYYMLLAYAIYRKKTLVIGIALGLCMMSRYYLLPWLSCYLIALFFLQDVREFFQTIAALALTCFFLIIISKVGPHLSLIMSLSDHYLEAVVADTDKFIYTMEHSGGMGRYFFPSRMGLLQSLLLGGALVIPVVGFLIYRRSSTDIDIHMYSLCLLKISMVWALSFMIIPYQYLFLPSLFVSLFMIPIFLRHREAG